MSTSGTNKPPATSPSVPECTACGCCCFSQQADYIRVFEADTARMDERALALTSVVDGVRSMNFRHGRCVALQLEDGYRCAIYPMRPDACRWLQRGSGECLRQIGVKSTDARDALVQLRRDGP